MKRKIIYIIVFLFLLVTIDRIVGLALNTGLNKYFGLTQHSEILLIGHSHLMLATDKESMEKETGLKVSKYCREGVNVADRYVMVKQFLNSEYSDSLKYVLFGVDQFMFTEAGLSQNSYKLFYPFIDNSEMDEYIKESVDDNFDYWSHKLLCSTRYSDALLNSAIRGWMNNWDNYKYGSLDVEKLIKDIKEDKQRKIKFEKELIDIFEETIRLLHNRGIKVILVNTPIAKPLNDYQPREYKKIISYFKNLANDGMTEYWDFNPEYSDQYYIFFDPIHLNPKGQKLINSEIVNNINNIK